MSQSVKSQSVKSQSVMSQDERKALLENKVKLKQFDQKCCEESANIKITENIVEIRELRSETSENHKYLAERVKSDQKLVSQIFPDRKEELLPLKHFRGNKILSCMDQKKCVGAKLLNLVQSQRLAKESRLQELKTMLETKRKKTDSHVSAEQRIRVIENGIDKFHIKHIVAHQLSDKYTIIKAKIEKEIIEYPPLLDSMEKDLNKMKAELKNRRNSHDTAKQARDMVKQELQGIAKDVVQRRLQSEEKITELSKQLEVNQRRRDHFAERLQQAGRRQATPPLFPNAMEAVLDGHKKKLLDIQATFSILRQNTAITEIADFIKRFENQSEVCSQLTKQADDVRKENNQLMKEKEDLQNEYTRLKYNGITKISNLEHEQDVKAAEIKQQKAKAEQTRNELQKTGETVIHVKEVFHALLKKILRPSLEEFRDGNSLADDMELFEKKMEQLVNDVNAQEKYYNQTLERLKEKDQLLVETAPSSTRIRILSSSSKTTSRESFHYSHEYDIVPTRSSIKAGGQQVIDAKNRKPKKAKKQKNARKTKKHKTV